MKVTELADKDKIKPNQAPKDSTRWHFNRHSIFTAAKIVMLIEDAVFGSRPFFFYQRQTELLKQISLISNSLTGPDRFPSFLCKNGIKWRD